MKDFLISITVCIAFCLYNSGSVSSSTTTTTYTVSRMESSTDSAEFANNSLESTCIQSFSTIEELNRITIFARHVTPVLFGLFFIVGFVGNFLVLAVIVANVQMRNTTNILIFSLALADLAFILICIPSATAVYLTGSWPLGGALCRVYYFFSYASVYCSVYTLLLMSVDRFLAVVYPIECVNLRTKPNAIKCVLVLWTVVLLTNLPLLINSRIVRGPAEGGDGPCVTEYCTYDWLVMKDEEAGYVRDNYQMGRLYFLLFFLFGYLIPFILISSLYITLICRLRCRRSSQLKQSAEARRSKRRVTRLVVAVVAMFGMSWLPLHVVFLYQYYIGDPNTDWFRITQIVCNCLAYGNSCINPVLYAFLSQNFRRAFGDLLHGRRTQTGYVNTCVNMPEETVHEPTALTRARQNNC